MEECSISMYKALGSAPELQTRTTAICGAGGVVVARACDPHTWEIKIRIQGHSQLHSKFQGSLDCGRSPRQINKTKIGFGLAEIVGQLRLQNLGFLPRSWGGGSQIYL